jgi:hypothetical protein
MAGRVSTGSGVCAERDISEALGRVCKEEIVMRAPFFEKKVNVFFAELPFSQDAFFCVKPDHPGSGSGRAECEQLKLRRKVNGAQGAFAPFFHFGLPPFMAEK